MFPMTSMTSDLEADAMQGGELALPTGNFVDTGWLAAHLELPGLRVVQVGGESYYDKLHIPGAVLADYKRLLSQEEGSGGRRAATTALATLFGELGIDHNVTVVAYDATGGMDGARFVWSLAMLGHHRAAVLDGGMAIWYQRELPVTPDLPVITPCRFESREEEGWHADWQRVSDISQGKRPGVVLDVRSHREYVGMSLRLPRGHVPGAVHMEWTEALADPKQPLLKSDAVNRSRLAALGAGDPAQEVVVLCETGHRASQTWLLLKRLGYASPRLYDGSMAEWRARDLPTVTGSDPR